MAMESESGEPVFMLHDTARAGGRMRLPGYVERSATCVHAEARGQGHAVSLTRALMRLAFEGGEVPFLHVRPDNVAAIALYKRLASSVAASSSCSGAGQGD